MCCTQAFTVLPMTLWLASLVAALTGRPGDPPLTDKQRQLVIGLHVCNYCSSFVLSICGRLFITPVQV